MKFEVEITFEEWDGPEGREMLFTETEYHEVEAEECEDYSAADNACMKLQEELGLSSRDVISIEARALHHATRT